MATVTKTSQWEAVTQREPLPLSMIASAVRMTLSDESWRGYRFTDETWQKIAWEFYDTNSQLHNAVDYVGNACSLVRLYVAKVDDNGVRQEEVTDDDEIAALADNLFGGPAAKAEILKNLAQSLTVAGECYLIGLSSRPAYTDKWMVVAPSEVRRQGKNVIVTIGHAVRETLNPGRDIIVRVHTPHPRRPLLADSPVRALMDCLERMRQIQLYKRAQFNSRIANAVVLPVPESLAIPKGDDESVSIDDIYQQLYEVITSNLEGKGTAAQVAPIIWPMPLAELEAMKGIQPIKFESVLSEALSKMEEQEIQNLAVGINVPVEIQIGSREMNHWGVWFAGEEFIVKSVMPLMGRIVDALTTAYLEPALKALGRNTKRFTYWYDVAPLASSANQATDMLNLYEKGVVSAETVRRSFNLREVDAPSDDETGKRTVKEVVLRDPTYFAADPVREYLGVDIPNVLPPAVEMDPNGPPPPPTPQRGIQAKPPGQGPPDTRPTATENQSDLIASMVSGPSATHVAANSMVLRALEVANKKLLTPAVRKAFPGSDILTLHTKVQVSQAQVPSLLAGAWDHCGLHMAGINVDQSLVASVLNSYTAGLLVHRIEHNPTLMSARLRDAGIS